jgi:predicted Zn-dependent peptidase
LISVALEELANLRNPVSEIELRRAKNITKMNMLMALERQEDRLEEMARNYQTFGELNFHSYCDKIDKVTSRQINAAADKMLRGRPTMVVIGGGIDQVPSIEQIMHALN